MPDEIKEFGYRPARCPKCGNSNYSWGVPDWPVLYSTLWTDRLRIECRFCGYWFFTKTLDAK